MTELVNWSGDRLDEQSNLSGDILDEPPKLSADRLDEPPNLSADTLDEPPKLLADSLDKSNLSTAVLFYFITHYLFFVYICSSLYIYLFFV